MMPRYASTSMASPLLLIVLFTAFSSGCSCPKEVHLTAILGAQTLTSPNYPEQYQYNESILWNIECDPGHVVHLRVREMDLQNSSLCGENRVTVWDSDNATLLATMCNHQYEGVNLYSAGNVLHVHFTSGLTVTGNGFSMLYRAVGPDESHESYRRTTTSSPSAGDEVRYLALVFAIIGSCLLVAVFVWIVRLLCRNKRPPRSASSTSSSNNHSVYRLPRPSLRPTPAVRPTPGVHRAVRSRPTILADRAESAETNGGMSPRGEGPPPYSSLQFSPEPPPPSYTDSMIIRHPPSKKK